MKIALQIWYCWMNSWDDARSSCSAPQEGISLTCRDREPSDDGASDDENVVGEDDEACVDKAMDDSAEAASNNRAGRVGREREREKEVADSKDNVVMTQGVSRTGRTLTSRFTQSSRKRR